MPDDDLRALLAGARVGDFVTATSAGIEATYLPVVYEPGGDGWGSFHLHLQRVNPQWRSLGEEALLILHGNTHLIRADYYAGSTSVGTLNYETAHVYGSAVVHDDPDYLWWVTERVAELNEPQWRIGDLDREAGEKMLRGAVGVELRISRVEAKAKLSQNKSPDVIRRLAEHLEGDRNPEAAALLRDRSLPLAEQRQVAIDAARETHLRRQAASRGEGDSSDVR